MERKKASDFPQELLNLFDLYVHGDIHRREFLDGAQKFAVGGVTVAALLEMLRPNYAWAIQVPENDSRIKAETATVQSPKGNGSISGYLVGPAGASGKLPVVLVVHENRGLNPYIKDVARRLAIANFMAFAPDSLTSVGGYPGDDERGGKLFSELDRGKMTEDFLAAAEWLKARPDSTGKIGAVGFCFGGGVVNILAVRMGADLTAGVPFYGNQPNAADTAKIKTPLLAHYGELDTRITSGWPAFDKELTAAHVRIRAMSIPAPITASTTTRRRVTTSRLPSLPGSARWTGSTSICASRYSGRIREAYIPPKGADGCVVTSRRCSISSRQRPRTRSTRLRFSLFASSLASTSRRRRTPRPLKGPCPKFRRRPARCSFRCTR